MLLSSPPRRGCFAVVSAPSAHSQVFPASAGVFPEASREGLEEDGLPRLGGGVSAKNLVAAWEARSSPPRRGCFRGSGRNAGRHCVFPASAGVFLEPQMLIGLQESLPRLGGGVSMTARRSALTPRSSPPRRGCFYRPSLRWPCTHVFPASAGVFPP